MQKNQPRLCRGCSLDCTLTGTAGIYDSAHLIFHGPSVRRKISVKFLRGAWAHALLGRVRSTIGSAGIYDSAHLIFHGPSECEVIIYPNIPVSRLKVLPLGTLI